MKKNNRCENKTKKQWKTYENNNKKCENRTTDNCVKIRIGVVLCHFPKNYDVIFKNAVILKVCMSGQCCVRKIQAGKIKTFLIFKYITLFRLSSVLYIR